MKISGPILKFSIPVNPAAEDIAGVTLEQSFGRMPAFYTDAETGRCDAILYLPADSTEPRKVTEAIRELLGTLDVYTGGTMRGEIEVTKLKKEDWANSWKKHFKPQIIGGKLLIKPSWSLRRARPGQRVIVLDPGLSFGTGHHATTRFCLRQIVRHSSQAAEKSILDIGTGSGILAIAAAKLGYGRVEAFDFDPEAVRVATANARTNRVLARIQIAKQDLTKAPLRSRRSYDIVCVNLIYDLLLSETRKLAYRVKPGGWIVLAGILQTQFPAVSDAFQKAGFTSGETDQEGEWQSGVFQFRGNECSKRDRLV